VDDQFLYTAKSSEYMQWKERDEMKKNLGVLANVAAALCLFLTVSGCVHRTDDSMQAIKLSKADMKFKNVYVSNFTISPKGVKEDEPKGFLADTESNCAAELMKSGLFDNIKYNATVDATDSSLIVQGELTELRIVGTGARIWLGSWAGKSEMAVHVKLVDAKTGALVAERDIKEDTNAHASAYSYGAIDKILPSRVGSLIAEYVVEAAKR
jgi:hypothetical protein